MAAADTKPTMYRVRIGKFKTKREAETVAARLQKEEQFKPWVTR
jgi:cell division protein FtsN